MKSADWRDYHQLVDSLSDRVAQGIPASHPHVLLSVTDSPALQLTCARTVVARKFAKVPPMSATREPARTGPLRVAYISADFHDHPVPKLLIGVLERHDRTRFKIVGVSLRDGRGHSFEQRIRQSADHWVDAARMTPAATASALRELGVDIAIDLTGYTEGMRLEIFAHRAAPVQVNYLGYAGTIAAPYLDYILADDTVIAPGTERWYSEQVVRLPNCYLPNDDRREIAPLPTRSAAGLPEEGFVFCAFTDAYKINPPLFDIWMRLLQEVAGSILWLRSAGADVRANLAREAQARGIDASRLIYAPYVADVGGHLARQALADLYLDTFPYNAHSTACDALWAGVPVLTCAGRSFASRVAASAVRAAGVPELVTADLANYEIRARQLAQSPQQLRRLRLTLESNRRGSPLFDTARYTRDLERAYEQMHARALRGLAPEAFTVAGSAA